MILDDFKLIEVRILSELQVTLQIWEATAVERIKIRLVLSATELYRTKCTFQRCTDYVNMIGVHPLEFYNQNTLSENGDF